MEMKKNIDACIFNVNIQKSRVLLLAGATNFYHYS